MTYYITFIDGPSGVFQSQVLDVINYLNDLAEVDVKLISFIPYSGFFENRKKLKENFPNSIVLPILFGVKRWKMTAWILPFITKKNAVAIGRGPIATRMALDRFKKVIYDGRAAVKAEIEEYNVTQNDEVGDSFIQAEKEVVLYSDFRIAVSSKLVEFWKNEFGYEGDDHVVIPCTLSSKSQGLKNIQNKEEIKLVYSGGTGGWQSFSTVVELLQKSLKSNPTWSVLFLTRENEFIDQLTRDYPGRVERKWLQHYEVFDTLSSCDYGILIREKKVTNYVASPVKYAEYLDAGLKVLISEEVGDLSDFTIKHNSGIIVKDIIPDLEVVSPEERYRLHNLARTYFSKNRIFIKERYKELVLRMIAD